MSPSDFVRVTSAAVAQIFNLYPRKGLVAAGSDADVIVLDPQAPHTLGAASHHSRMDTNIYEGRRVKSRVVSGAAGAGNWHCMQLIISGAARVPGCCCCRGWPVAAAGL
jgi:dihydropyrimidinase